MNKELHSKSNHVFCDQYNPFLDDNIFYLNSDLKATMISTAEISEADLSSLNKLAHDLSCPCIFTTPNGWMIKLTDDSDSSRIYSTESNYPGLSDKILELFEVAKNESLDLIEVNSNSHNLI